ncbi:MAG: signal peptidase I [candidate division KSB1 bacterium]|nr:signal peptidase I [candidate division KSB1 bacterium]MDZ7334775.1 signal peptidase I [candidate division KSB1 bacterium]MDZ7357173.1 signal peptidase I [candidate division KSB1 bacterium]MDZ7398581.1 signal peptidase I [candidate division KSB1 bacterium]
MVEMRKQNSTGFIQSLLQWYRKRQEAKRRRREASKKSKLREYIEAVLVAFVAAMILRILVVQAFRIPTGSMKDTLLVGDFLLVNKFIYGVRTPEFIPLLNIRIPYGRLPGLREPKPGDIVVFKYPLDKKLDYIKRCIAVGGQTIEIRNGTVFVDGQPEGQSTFVKRAYDPDEGVYVLYYQIHRNNGKKYTIRLYENIGYVPQNFGPIIGPNGKIVEMRQNEIFIDNQPGGSARLLNKAYQQTKQQYQYRYLITDLQGSAFEVDYYESPQPLANNNSFAPLWIPKKGAKIKINQDNYHLYQKIIEDYEKNEVTWRQGKLWINGTPTDEYTFKDDYLFMMGDNRDNSADSRSWGFLPRDHVVGQALIIYFSWDQRLPLYKFFKKVRWARITDIIR